MASKRSMPKKLSKLGAMREFGSKRPKSICKCGHTGDGAKSSHSDAAFISGHGPCTEPGCKCKVFTWADWTRGFKAFLTKYT